MSVLRFTRLHLLTQAFLLTRHESGCLNASFPKKVIFITTAAQIARQTVLTDSTLFVINIVLPCRCQILEDSLSHPSSLKCI
ncbi:hypothetical protein V5799_034461 [Amblyomma americanum]|uniref:Uncharacterized protein n=1 Tax=Amblyomma americanum TaxID=6943 RepID=A0AAQ4DKE0_AMBAM